MELSPEVYMAFARQNMFMDWAFQPTYEEYQWAEALRPTEFATIVRHIYGELNEYYNARKELTHDILDVSPLVAKIFHSRTWLASQANAWAEYRNALEAILIAHPTTPVELLLLLTSWEAFVFK